MKAINIFALTRIAQKRCIRRFDRQMSGRDYYLLVKDWEVDGLRKLSERLCCGNADLDKLYFFYSFQIPKLGKEFDLLQISEDKVLNIELKSQPVEDFKIRKQLLLNKSYLSLLGKDVYSFTYVSSRDRLVRLTNSGRLTEAGWEELRRLLRPGSECVLSGVEDLFLEEKYLLSPLSDPDRFLRRDYFLTAQQKDIRSKIIRVIEEKSAAGCRYAVQGFTGLPGTGKTLLLYDLAMYFSRKQRVCILHFGNITEEIRKLDTLLKRIDFISADEMESSLDGYALVCVDEGHRMKEEVFLKISSLAKEKQIPVVISYDDESMLCPEERKGDITRMLEEVPGYIKYSLTNRIRTNRQLSTFIRNMIHLSKSFHRMELPGVQIVYANDASEAVMFEQSFQEKGYRLIAAKSDSEKENISDIEVFFKEYEYVVMTVGEELYYDSRGYLREKPEVNGLTKGQVSRLFHGLNRAKKGLALVIVNNEPVFETLLKILQGEEQC